MLEELWSRYGVLGPTAFPGHEIELDRRLEPAGEATERDFSSDGLTALSPEAWEHCRCGPGGHCQLQEPRRAGVTTFARRLMAIERARARRSVPADFGARLRGRKPGHDTRSD